MNNFFAIYLLLILFVNAYCFIRVYPLEDEKINDNTNSTDYRLHTNVIPKHYNLTLQPYLLENEFENKTQFTFDGYAAITLFTNYNNVNEIELHAKNLNINYSLVSVVNLDQNITIPINDTKYDSLTDKLKIILNGTLPVGESILYFHHYVGYLNDDMQGFYRSNYTQQNGTTRWIAATQFESVHARKAFPCFDEPQFKATFQLTIKHNKLYNVVSNTAIEDSKDDDQVQNRKVTIFKKTPQMSTYLLAILVSDFSVNDNESDLAVIAREDAKSQTEYALTVGKKLLDKLDEYTALPYKRLGNPKMHLAAIPDFSAGAMENWGLLTFRERLLLFDGNSTTASAQQSIATVIAHEQTHMWFGDYVTCKWWNVTWLNEGFASYFEYFITHEVHSEWELDKQFVIDQLQNVFVTDSLNNTHPLTNNNTNSPADIDKMFDTISYHKGASVIRMIKHMLGEDNFKAALQSYFRDPDVALNTSLPENLFKAFKSKWTDNRINLDTIKEDWTEQVGYPVVKIELSDDRKSFKVSQKRFVLNNDVPNKELKYTIPFTFITNKNVSVNSTKPDLYITKDKDSVTVNLTEQVEWVIGNKLQTGYYRVNYDDKTWDRIRQALLKEGFSNINEVNRAQIVDDLFNFGRSGLLTYDRVLNYLSYLTTENNYLPWYSAFNGLNTIAIRIDDNNFKLFKDYILAILEDIYKKVGFNEKENEKRLEIYNRAQVLQWACNFGHDDCIKNSKQLFEKLKKDNQSVPVNIRSVVYCTALREGNSSDFEFLWQKYKNEHVATEQVLILGVLGCSKSKEVIEKYLQYIISPDIRRQDKSAAFSSTYTNNRENIPVVFNFIKVRVEDFKNAFGNYSDVASLLSSLSSRFTTDDQKKQLEEFYNKNKDKFGDGSKTLENALKNVENNLKWSKDNLPKLVEFFKAKFGGAVTRSVSLSFTAIIVLFGFILNN